MSDDEAYCPICGAVLEWEDCYEPGCDDGEIDAYDDDPLWFQPGDTYSCETCGGEGGWLVCPTAPAHTGLF